MLNISSTIETDEIIMNSKYNYIIVQSVRCNNGVQHGDIHVCPVPGQYPFTPDLFVECPKSMKTDYPVGTKFRIKAKITLCCWNSRKSI